MVDQAQLYPSASIVVPTYNRAGLLHLCLPPLLEQTYPRDRYEIILINDGSTDDTVVRANALVEGWTGTFRIISKANGGPASARNAGIWASQADIVVFIDSDCIAERDWLEILIKAMTASDAVGIGAPTVIPQLDNWVARYMSAMEFYPHRIRDGQVDYLVTQNVAFRRSVLNEMGGFDDQPGAWVEDVDLSFKIKSAGYKLAVISDGAVKDTGTPKSIPELAKNLFRYGRGNSLRSSQWQSWRKPHIEFIRHSGAVVLSPLIAFSTIQKVGIGQALSFVPLIMVEHGAFALGIVSGMLQKRKVLDQI